MADPTVKSTAATMRFSDKLAVFANRGGTTTTGTGERRLNRLLTAMLRQRRDVA
jgi:hypothetical protein